MRRTASAGLSRLELTFIVSLLALLFAGAAVVWKDAARTIAPRSTAECVERELDAAMNEVIESLRSADFGRVAPKSVKPQALSTIDFTRVASFVDGKFVCGATERIELQRDASDPTSFNLLHTFDVGLPSERTEVIASGVPKYLEGEKANAHDDNGNGLIDEPGFSIDFDGRVATVRLSLRQKDADTGVAIQRSVTRSVAMLNP